MQLLTMSTAAHSIRFTTAKSPLCVKQTVSTLMGRIV